MRYASQLAGEALTYIPRKAIVPVSRSGGCHFLLTYRSASCAQYTEHIRIKNIVVVLHIVTKQSPKFELYAGKGGQAMSLTKLVSQGAVDNCIICNTRYFVYITTVKTGTYICITRSAC